MVDVPRFAERLDAARMTPVDAKPGFGHRFRHRRFHLAVRGLQDIAGTLSGADIGTEMNPCFRSVHEPRPARDKGIEAQMTELMAA